LIKNEDIDVVVSLYGFPFAGSLFFAKYVCSTPTAILEHHLGAGLDVSAPDENPEYIEPILQRTYPIVDAVIATSNTNRTFVETVSGRDDVKIIPLGVDVEGRHPRHSDPVLRNEYSKEGPLLLTVSRLVERKNITDLFDAMQYIIETYPTAHLVVVGKGPERETLRSEINRSGLTENITLTGRISEDRLEKLFATADLYLSTATYEGFGLSILEALASGTPTVVYDAEGTRDFLSGLDCAAVIDHDSTTLARTTIQFLENKEELARRSIAAREYAVSNYSWDSVARDHLEVFKKIVDERDKNRQDSDNT
jgi:glycosyltransferase involved in cell wall biosynthesis